MELSPRAQILIYLLLLILFSAWAEGYLIRVSGTVYASAFYLLGLLPGALGLLGNRFFGYDLEDARLAPAAPKYFVFAYAAPALIALLTLGSVWLLGVAGLRWPESVRGSVRLIVLVPTLLVLVEVLSATAKEFGWRGYLVTRWEEAEWPYPNLSVGLIESLWLWPLIIWCNLAPSENRALTLALFTLGTTSFAIFLGWLRTRAESLWPVVLAHAVRASFVGNLYSALVEPTRYEPLYGGIAGLVPAALYLILAFCVHRLA